MLRKPPPQNMYPISENLDMTGWLATLKGLKACKN